VEENLRVPAAQRGPWNATQVFALFPRLGERRNARALLLNPRLLLLDEPSEGLAPRIVKNVFEVIVRMRAEGMSVLLVEQNVRVALAVASQVSVLNDGRIAYTGRSVDFATDEDRLQRLVGARARIAAEKAL